MIVDIPRPKNAREVEHFMGHCGFHQRFTFQYASIAQPLYILTSAYEWTYVYEESFNKLRNALIETPILRAP